MPISIIIPTVSEPTLDRVVQSAKRELPDAEIIIVGFGPSKDIARINDVQFLDTMVKTPKPIGINKAVKIAKNDWIIILDADAIPQKGWGENMLSSFMNKKKIFGGSVNISVGNFWMKVYNLSYFHEFLPDNPPQYRKHLPAITLGFTKETYSIAGKWDERLIRSQDFEWTLRCSQKGLKPWFEPKAAIVHLPTTQNSLSSVMSSWERNGYYNWIVRKQYQDIISMPKILQKPTLVLLLSPILALVPTLRILLTSPKNFIRYIYLIPFVYLTKIAWCLGVYNASRHN